MKGRMTVTVNANEDVCAIQKAGDVGIPPGVVMQCLRIASVKAADITNKIENAVRFIYFFDLSQCILESPLTISLWKNKPDSVESCMVGLAKLYIRSFFLSELLGNWLRVSHHRVRIVSSHFS